MKKIILLLFLCGITLTACELDKGYTFIGTTKSYKSFLGKDYNWNVTTLPTQHLQLTMGNLPFSQRIRLGLFYQSTQNCTWTLPINKEFVVFKNGKQLPDNTFTIEPGEDKVDIAFRLKEGAEEKTYKIGVRLLEAGDLDMLNGQMTSDLINQKEAISNVTWTVKHKEVINPLKLGLLFGLGGIIAILILWIGVLRYIFFKRFRFSSIQIIYKDENGDRVGQDTETLSGAYKVVLYTDQIKRQGFLERLLSGKVIYITNRFWTSPAEITSCGSEGMRFEEKLINDNVRLSYRARCSMILPSNGAMKPYVVSKLNEQITANISIS